MSPRFLGCRVVLVRSFARIHETNLKKQGVLPLTFADADDYEHIMMDDRLSFVGLDSLEPGKPVQVKVRHADGSEEEIVTQHSMNEEQISWFNAGSALNMIRKQQAEQAAEE
jgi:aconitate hydratase